MKKINKKYLLLAAQDGEVALLFSEECTQHSLPCGLVVRISGFHPGGPGSIPGMGRLFTLPVYEN